MNFKEQYNFWVDRRVAGFIYRFQTWEIRRRPVNGPELFELYKTFSDQRETAREWRKICNQAAEEAKQ